MAEKQAGGLSLRIGITLSELQSDFLQAEQTVRQGIAALNRQQNIVRLRMETDVTGLDSFADKTKIIEVREQALSQLLEMQRDRLTLATKAFQEYTSGKNVNATETKKLETAMERERLAVARLESELKNLSSQKVSLDTSNLQSNIDKITAKIGNIRIKAEIDTAKLQGSDKIFETQKIQAAALTKELELQRQKLIQLRAAMYQSAKTNGSGSVQTLNIKSNVLKQIQEINQLETKLKELSNTNVNLQIKADAIKQVEQVINENIARINARIENIRVKTEIDTSKISAAASEFDKAKVHVQGLTQELNLQNQKLLELKKALGTSISTNGLNNVKTINLQTDIQRQIQEIDRLKAKLDELNKITPPKTNNLLSGYLNIKGDITGKLNSITTAFSNLQGATSSADSAITATLGVIGEIPHPVGRAVAALASLPIIFKGVENSIVDLLKASASAGDSVYVMSRGFQMSVADTGKFTAMCKTAGVEVNDLASTIKRTQQQIIRGGDNAKAEQWLKRYGESAFDANGHLKNMNDMTLTLSRALKRAQAEGNGMAFILGTMRSASADAITAIEDAEGVYQQAEGLVKNGLANPVLAHEVQGNINAMNLQASFMKASFESALLPVAHEIVPKITERMGELTKLIANNADLIKDFGSAIGNVFLTVEGTVDKAVRGVISIAGALHDIYSYRDDLLVERYKNDADVQSVEDLFKKELQRSYTSLERIQIENNPSLYEQTLKRYEPIFKAIREAHEKVGEENLKLAQELQKIPISVADISSAAADRFKVEENPELLKQAESIKKILQEASDIQYKLSHSDYENKKLDILQWQQDILNQEETTAEKREAIEKLSAAKLAQIDKELADKLAEIRKNANAEFKSGIEQRIDKINEEKEAWISAGMDAAEAMELSQRRISRAMQDVAREFESEVDRIKGSVQTLEDKIFEIDHSQYQNDLRKIQQEYLRTSQELQQQGLLPFYKDDLDYLYERQKQELAKRAKKDRNYRKSPEGAMERGGNGITVISGDQVVDDGLIQSRQKEIGLLADENQIRMQLLQQKRQELSDNSWAMLAQQVQQIQQSQITLPQPQQQQTGIQIIEGDKVVAMPEVSIAPLQEFNAAIEQLSSRIQQQNPFESMISAGNIFSEKIKQMEQELPAEYFRNIADGAQGVSEMQMRLTDSTMKLIDAQENLRNVLSNLPSKEIQMQTNLPTNGIRQLSTQDFIDMQQDLLNRRTRELEQLPAPQTRNKGVNLGFDMETAGTVLGLGALLAGIGGAPITAPIAAGITALSALGGLAKGTYDNSTAQNTPLESNVDLTQLVTPLTSIDDNVQSVLQDLQNRQETTISMETVIAPLNNIATITANILSAIGNRKQPDITISPSIRIDLGGAYVFDSRTKKELTDDITKDIVTEIEKTVRQATRQSSYSYGA